MTRGRDDRVCLGVKIDRINIIMAMINVRIVAPYRTSFWRTTLLLEGTPGEPENCWVDCKKSITAANKYTHFLQILLLQPLLLTPLNTEPESYHSVACMPVIRKLKVRISWKEVCWMIEPIIPQTGVICRGRQILVVSKMKEIVFDGGCKRL